MSMDDIVWRKVPVLVEDERDDNIEVLSFNPDLSRGLAIWYGMLVAFEGRIRMDRVNGHEVMELTESHEST